jgi:hypothetical protein
MGLKPEEILSKEAQLMPHRTVIDCNQPLTGQQQIDTMMRALIQKLKQDIITEIKLLAQKRSKIIV